MADLADTGQPMESQQRPNDEIERPGFEPASKDDRVARFYARHAALATGGSLEWTDDRRHPWPRKDRINWVELRLAETEIKISQCQTRLEEERSEQDEKEKERLEQACEDCETWLLKEREGQSWVRIVKKRLEQIGISRDHSYEVNEAVKSAVRRAHERVEREHPGSGRYEPEPLQLDGYCSNCGYPWL
jgi:hypothetical protein